MNQYLQYTQSPAGYLLINKTTKTNNRLIKINFRRTDCLQRLPASETFQLRIF